MANAIVNHMLFNNNDNMLTFAFIKEMFPTDVTELAAVTFHFAAEGKLISMLDFSLDIVS